MSVNVSLSEEVSKEKGFPKLMINDRGMVVLFLEPKMGTVIKVVDVHQVGLFLETWYMGCFTDYNGEVTLKNE
jgi:hypothetical protein